MQIRVWMVGILICACSLFGSAQETRGSIVGQVRDGTGAVVPGASLAAKNIATNVIFRATTNKDGAYQVPLIPPGTYTITADAAGFKTTVREHVQIDIHAQVNLDLALELGSVTERVMVTGDSPLLETASANMGQAISSQNITELPLSYGSVYETIFLTNGVSTFNDAIQYQDQGSIDGLGGESVVNGTPAGTEGFSIDGVNNRQIAHGQGPMTTPPADLIDEAKAETAYDASAGSSSGEVFNVSLKSGTNTLHGTADYFAKPPNWAANTYLGNFEGQPRGDSAYKRWGATIGGPVYIPKLYDGRNRTFFIYGYDAFNLTSPDGSIDSVPTAAEVGGDFSALLKVSPQYQIYDPATIQPAGNGRYSRQPFADNIIPTGRISPIATAMLKHYPKPNQTGNADGSNNYGNSSHMSPGTMWSHTVKIDQFINDKQRLTGRYTQSYSNGGPYRDYWDDPVVGENFLFRVHDADIDYIDTINSSTVLNVSLAYSRYFGAHAPNRNGFDVSKLGFPTQTTSELQATYKAFPQVGIQGLTALSFEFADVSTNDIYELNANLSKQRGNHYLKFGADITQYRVNYSSPGSDGAGNFQFDSVFTNGPVDNSPSSPNGVGQGLAAMLLGQPDTGTITVAASQADRSTVWGFYLQDNWRATTRLTFDLGARWEYWEPYTERYNRSVRGFNPTASLPIAAAAMTQYAANPDSSLPANQFKVQGGLQFAGVGGVPSTLWDTPLHGILAPRFGFSYHVHPKVVVRGGFGLFPFQPAFINGSTAQSFAVQSGYSQTTSFVPTLNNGQTFTATLANPFPDGVLKPAGSSLGASTFLGKAISFYNPKMPQPYTMDWSFNVQTMLPANFLVEAAYVGTKSLKSPLRRNVDALPNKYLSTSPVRDQNTINYLTAQITNPFSGLLPGTNLNGTTITRSTLLQPNPQFSGITMVDYQGWSWYNSLQVRLERRLSNGISLSAGYTFSKNTDASTYLNAGDPVPTAAIAAHDHPEQFSFNGMWKLPIGKGKALLGGSNRVLNQIVGDWQVSGVWETFSGDPISFGDVLFTGNPGNIALPRNKRNVLHWFNTSGFVTDPTQQLADNLRKFPIRLGSVRTAGYNSADLSLEKSIFVREKYQFELRLEGYNAFNHPSGFDNAVTAPTSSAFGQITYMDYTQRTLQYGLKFLF